MQAAGKRRGAVGAAFTMGSSTSRKRISTLARAIRSQNARVTRMGSYSRSRLRRRNAVTAGYLGLEIKYFDTYFAATTLAAPTTPGTTQRANPATLLSLNAVSTGDGPSNRDGKKIRLRSLYIKGTIYRAAVEDQAAPQEPIAGYVACVLDKQCNAAEIAPDQVYRNPMGAAIGNSCLFRNLEYSDRYRILRDQVFSFGAGPQSAYALDKISNGGAMKHFEWYIPLNFDTLFNTVNPTAATIADIVTNAIGMVATATISSGNNTLVLTYNCRLRFVG